MYTRAFSSLPALSLSSRLSTRIPSRRSSCLLSPTSAASLLVMAIAIANSAWGAVEDASTNASRDYKNLEHVEVKGLRGGNMYRAGQASSGTKLRLAVEDIPQSISVVTRAQIEDFGLIDINQVLQGVTGVNVDSVETDRTYYNARGFEINNFQIDGIGLPLRSGNINGRPDTAIYERIEVVRGANGLMTGVGNPSATVNSLRKRPTDAARLSVSATAGAWDLGRLEADASGQLTDNVRARAVWVEQQEGSYLDRYQRDKRVIYTVADWRISDHTLLTAGLSHEMNNANSPMWGTLPLYYSDGSATNFDTSTSTSADWAYWDSSRQSVFVEAKHDINDRWNLTAVYNMSQEEEDSKLFYVYGTPDSDTGLGLTGYASDYDLNSSEESFDVFVNGDIELGGRDHDIVLGANWSAFEYTDLSLYDDTTGNGFPPMPALEAWTGDAPIPVLVDRPSGSDVSDKQWSLYATGRFQLTEAMHLIAGARSVDWQAKGESYGNTRVSKADDIIPYLGTTYNITDSLTAYASYTEVFLPQTEEDINGNLLDPVTGESKEVGIKAQLFDNKVLATAAWFDVQQVNVAVQDIENSRPDQSVYYGADGIRSRGYELSLVGQLMDGLQTSIGFTQFDLNGDDDVEDYTPEQTLNLAATYAWNDWRVGANVTWQEAVSRVQVRDGSGVALITTQQDAYALVNLMAAYQATEQLSVSMQLKNAGDEKYINSLKWAQGYYAAPRHLTASVRYQF